MEHPLQRLTPGELKSYASDISAILHLSGTKSYFLKQLSKKNRSRITFTYLDSRKFRAAEVDYDRLAVIADVTMYHKFSDSGVFSPTYNEVLCQIPSNYIEDVVAFEIMYAPSQDEDLEIFADEVCDGYHVFVVRLYGRKKLYEEPAPVPFDYPKGATVPEGMFKEDFDRICEIKSSQWID